MTDQITLLGTKGGPAIRQGGAMPTASLVQMAGQTIVVDCGIGVSRSLVEAGVSLLDFRTIFITHLHSDHVLELGPLIYTAWTTGLSQPVTVYGPEGIASYWEGFLAAMEFDATIRVDDEGRRPISELVRIEVFGEGPVAQIGPVRVAALRVDHPPVTETYALKFTGRGRCAVFSADTCYFPPLAAFARGADVLVHEAMLTQGVDALVAKTGGMDRLRAHLMASHSAARDVGRIAAAAEVGRLVLYHLIPADDPHLGEADWLSEVAQTWNGPVTVGRDGMVISFG